VQDGEQALALPRSNTTRTLSLFPCGSSGAGLLLNY